MDVALGENERGRKRRSMFVCISDREIRGRETENNREREKEGERGSFWSTVRGQLCAERKGEGGGRRGSPSQLGQDGLRPDSGALRARQGPEGAPRGHLTQLRSGLCLEVGSGLELELGPGRMGPRLTIRIRIRMRLRMRLTLFCLL